MAVTVRIGSTATEKYAEGQHVTVKEGHLHVFDGAWANAQVLAVYAPGQWRSAAASTNPAEK